MNLFQFLVPNYISIRLGVDYPLGPDETVVEPARALIAIFIIFRVIY